MQHNYSPEMIQQLSEELEAAIEREEIELEYEPIIELNNSRISGISTLVRWLHPKYGKIMPKDFIQLAETSDNINILGKWILEHACRQFSKWGMGLIASKIYAFVLYE